jgi:hypothetical protein
MSDFAEIIYYGFTEGNEINSKCTRLWRLIDADGSTSRRKPPYARAADKCTAVGGLTDTKGGQKGTTYKRALDKLVQPCGIVGFRPAGHANID